MGPVQQADKKFPAEIEASLSQESTKLIGGHAGLTNDARKRSALKIATMHGYGHQTRLIRVLIIMM